MKKILMSAAMVLSLVGTAVMADPIGYPGSTWGVLTAPSSVLHDTPEANNWLYQGKITQGVDWFKFGSDDTWVFDTYGSLGLSVDRNKLDYNNKFVPAIGAKVSKLFDNGSIDVGVEGLYERHFGDVDPGYTGKRSGFGVQAYVSYWFGWNLK